MASHIATLLLLLACGISHAQTAAAPPPSDLGSSLIQLVFGLGGVLALLVGSLWLIKKLLIQRGEGAGLLRVVSGTAVGARERVVIVEIGSTWLVLGVAPGHISALAEIPRQALPTTDPAANGASGRGFPDWLRDMSQKK